MLYLGANARRFYPDEEKRRRLRSLLGLQHDDRLVIYAGKLEERKRVHLLIRAVAGIGDSAVRLLLLGSGTREYRNKMMALVREVGMENRVIMHDFVPNSELPAYYCAADVGVWPGGASNTIQEAMACALPVIISKRTNTEHLVSWGGGYVFPQGDLETLMHYLQKLVSNDSLRVKLALEARKAIEEHYSWEVIAAQSLAMYQQVIGNRQRQAHDKR
jgi:glycosyltransferase involved in cell wall biosynthesis